ncbi:Transposon TX1 uncharacterized 149 kDa protein [Linum grandiflorum]
MYGDKAPDPDGYPAGFYQRCWTMVGDDVIDAVLYFFKGGALLHFVNSVSLALIPKRVNATDSQDYQPISCCNVVYKAISKVLANRLRGVLSDLINPAQSAFIKGRLIGDNILLAMRCFGLMGRRQLLPGALLRLIL